MDNILDMVDDYILILDKHWNIKFCNKKLLTKLKYNLDDLKNNSFDKIIVWENTKLNKNIEDISIYNNLEINIDLLSKFNKEISIYSNTKISDFKGEECIFFIGRDICEKSYKREDLEKILDTLPFNSWLKNMNGEYVYLNESYAKELKDNRLNILGKKTKEYWNKEMSKSFNAMDFEVMQSKKNQLTEKYSKCGEAELWVEVYKAPILNNENDVEYIVGFTKDITLRKKQEKEMYIKNKEMYIKNKEINNSDNIQMKANTKDDIKDVISNIGENIVSYFQCDGLSFLFLNKEKSSLDIAINCGEICKHKPSEEMLKYDLNELNYTDYLDIISNIKDINNELLKNYMLINKIENIGIYKIAFNDETMGFLVLKFLENSTVKFNKFDYLKTIASNIATMIKSHTLSKELQDEFEKRKEIEHELELFLDISVDLVARGNLSGEIKHVNSNWSKTLGWSEEELLSMKMFDIIDSEFKTDYRRRIDNVNDDSGCIVNKMICKDGSRKWLECNYKVLRSEDKYIITAKDITEQRKQEEERKFLEKAIEMESLKNEFFANISHEFRTPLNIILGTMQLMKKNIENNRISYHESLNLESHINYIKQNSYRLLRLVNNLIDITCIDSGYYELQLGNHNIVSTVENITLSVAQYIKDQGINLVFDTNCEEQIIACDPDKIERIVLNLLSNSIKYTDKDGYIYVELEADEDRVKVSVKDNGVGMPKEKLEVIFDRFKKIDNNLNRKCEGSGIGLSLVKSLVELQNGKIYVDSELGVGSVFTFELPIGLVDDGEDIISYRDISKSTQIEKCNIEFSDIYS
ncbi:MAG: ATP-binding protein [Terrisporobacter sp.]|uniref:ATP-binding protein n=1 Tax=Terrisporobacter sp. TaxID=1965305 RepID=UPI002FC58D0F